MNAVEYWKRKRMQEPEGRLKLENGDVLYYLGENRILTVIREDRKRSIVKCVQGRLLLFVPYEADYEEKRRQLEKWYRKEAALVLHQKASEFAKLLSVSFEDVRIKDQKSRWGSCSSKGNLNFNFRIIMAPNDVCNYVVMHELCHLVYMDHSKNFWNLLQSICPDYKSHKMWLKQQGKTLYLL